MYNPEESMPLDFTGYGPSGAGNYPNAEQAMANERNKFHSTRAIEAMRMQDPYMKRAMESQVRILGKTNDPAEVRRRIYNTASGQAGQDVAFGARRAGWLGSGDPVNTSNNVMRGVTGGGFGVNAVEELDGGRSARTVGFGQRVSGAGAIAERVAINYQEGLMKDLYGGGTPDPEKLHGFDMEAASEVFAKMARDGGLGSRAATVVKDASLSTRLDAAQAAAVDPTIKEGLANLDMEKLAVAEAAYKNDDPKKLNEFLDTIQDPKLKEEVSAVVKSKSAVVVNEDSRKEVAGAVKEAIKGLASLKDIYGEMSTPELQLQMRALTGIRVKDKASARQANKMVDSMRGAAEASGYDPKAFLDSLQANTAGLAGQIGQILGIDARGGAAKDAMAGMFRQQIGTRSVAAAQMAKETEAGFLEMGISNAAGAGRSVESYQADIMQGQMEYIDQFKGATLVRGAKSMMGEEDQKAADKLLEEFSSATPEKRRGIEVRLQNLAANSLGDGSLAQAQAKYGQRAVENIAANRGGAGDAMNADINRMRNEDVLVSGMTRNLTQQGFSKEESEKFANLTSSNVGGSGLRDLEMISKDKNTKPEDKRKAMMQKLQVDAEMSEADAASYLDKIYDKDGKRKMSDKNYGAIVETTATEWDPTSTKYAGNRMARDLLNNSDAGSARGKVADKDGALSVRGIVNAIATGKSGNLDSEEGKTLLMQTMKDNGQSMMVDGEDVSKQFATGLNLSKGMTQETLAQIQGVVGDKVNVAEKLGYKSNEEMFEKTKNSDKERAKMFTKLKEDENLNMTGGIGSMNITTDKALSMIDSKKTVESFKGMAAAQNILFPTMSEPEQTGMMEDFRKTGNMDIHMQADKFDGEKDGEGFFGGGKQHTEMFQAHKFRGISERVSNSSDASLEAFAKSDAGEQTLQQMEAQMESYRAAKKAGVHVIDTMDDKGKKLEGGIELSDPFMKSQEAAIEKLKEAIETAKGMQSVGVMKVERMEVTNSKTDK